MAVSSNQRIGELARIAYLALLHAEGELGEETNTFDGDKWSEKLRGIRSAILAMFSDTDNKVDLDAQNAKRKPSDEIDGFIMRLSTKRQ
jgi:hypothetical protein